MPRAVLNGRDVTLPDAPSLADALRAVGVHLPALCHDERLAPTGACRLCLVRVNGAQRPVPACATPVIEGLRIDTSQPDLEAARRGMLRMLAHRYPAEAVRVDPSKPFHQEGWRCGDRENSSRMRKIPRPGKRAGTNHSAMTPLLTEATLTEIPEQKAAQPTAAEMMP